MKHEPRPEGRTKEIFLGALDQPAADVDAYLRRACAGDAGLRTSVEELLSARERAEGFLDSPAIPSVRPDVDPDEIGPYKVLERIGEGGMGVVYLAEQRHPVIRRVALKVVKGGLNSAEVLARFQLEYQALAMMNHANVARVYDAGVTEAGFPYFVMEHVPGVPLTEFCDRECLDLSARLALFILICQGVQHAHQKGVIHRDLKPSNILVMFQDGQAVPKIIDFGIAKATDDHAQAGDIRTEVGRMIGTPAYMSPEQAGAIAGASDIDTRTDVYSLGIVLYELLTGTLPYEAAALRAAGYAEIQRIKLEEEPCRPSLKLGPAGDESTTTARNRGTDTRSLVRRLRGDLDWIVLKCLERDRSGRYESASAVAADIVRHLENEPVLAGPPSRVYRLRKFVRKNRGLVTAVSTVFVTLVVGLLASIWALREVDRAFQSEILAHKDAKTARDEEASAREDAERDRAEAERVRAEILRFSDGLRVGEAQRVADQLWPAELDRVPELEAWLKERAAHLEAGFSRHVETLAMLRHEALDYSLADRQHDRESHPRAGDLARITAELDAATESLAAGDSVELQTSNLRLENEVAELTALVAVRRTFRFAETDTQWQHDTLSDLVASLRIFLDDDPRVGTVASVKARLALAQDLDERSRTGPQARAAWIQALGSIQSSDKYGVEAKEMTPQAGLIPLGTDPQSGLEEFLHLPSHMGAIPERNADGHVELTQDLGLILVLIPGGSFFMGAERATETRGVSLVEKEGTVTIESLATGSLGHRLGALAGDVIVEVNGTDTSSIDSLGQVLAPLRTGDSITLRVRRDGEHHDLEGALGPNIDPLASANQGPVHEVTLSPYFISKYEMTQAQWKRGTGEDPSEYGEGFSWAGHKVTLLNPVENVSWDDCERWLPRLGLELPTEACWERAARGGTTTIWWCGGDKASIESEKAGNLADAWTQRRGGPKVWRYEDWLNDGIPAHGPVGSFAPNPYGLHDVIGNVWEWCRDGYWVYDAKDPAPGDGLRPILGSQNRVNRGSSFNATADYARSAARHHNTPENRFGILGVRPARSIR